MDAEAKQSLGEADPEQVHQGLQPIVALGPLALTLALVFWFWGQWHVVLGLVGIGVGLTLFLLLFIERLATRFGRSTAESVRVLVNAVGLSVGGVLTHWSPLVWVFV